MMRGYYFYRTVKNMRQNNYLCITLKKAIIMDLATRKYNFIQRLFEIDENLFDKLEQFLDSKKSANSISLEQYNIELNQANLRIENGEFYSSEEVDKIAGQW
jgi:type VI protein secretion system component Hcp